MPNQHGGQSTMSRASAQGSLAAGPHSPGGVALTGASADGNAVQKTVTSLQKLRVGTTIRASVIASTGKATPAKAPPARHGAAKPIARPAIPASIRSAPDTGNQLFAARQGKSGETPKTERPANVTTAKAKSRLKVGAAVHAKILNITKPGEPARSNSPQTLQDSRAAIAGTVTGAGPAGTPQVQTPVGTLSMNGVARLPLGTNLVLDITPAPTSGKSILPQNASAAFAQVREWPSLEQAINQLRAAPTDMAQTFNRGQLPQANNRLAANILFYLGALRGGDIQGWMGNSINLLDQSQPDLAGRVREDFALLARTFNESPQNDWRTLIIPFINGYSLEPVQMHMRGQSANADGNGSEEASRFLVDINLSRLGRIQMDGLVKSKGRKFDLIFRTETPLPARMRIDISRIFHEFAEIAGIRGGVTFQANARFIEVPIASLDGRRELGLIV
ncbi:MAG: hypothetical protein CMM10_10385 [Rhodospirillaceae bacterium]|nr:hypothetical protein [Rhodospirillaceae bacterium]